MTIDHVFLDMDGVLCDFVTPALSLHKRADALQTWPAGTWDIASVLGVSDEEFWKPINEAGHDFWFSLQPYPWMDRLVSLVTLVSDWTIASSPSQCHHSASGKVAWLDKYFGFPFRKYLLGPDKHHLGKPGHLLIDDNDKNCCEFEARGGKAILFPQPWNELHRHASDPIEYVAERLVRITDNGR